MIDKVTITVKVPQAYVEAIDELVRRGRFSSRSEAIRVAIKELIKKEMILAQLDNDTAIPGWYYEEE